MLLQQVSFVMFIFSGWPSHSCECNISQTPLRLFLKIWNKHPLESRTNWLNFDSQSRGQCGQMAFNFSKHDISETPWENFFTFCHKHPLGFKLDEMIRFRRSRSWAPKHDISHEHSICYEPAQTCMSAETILVHGGIQSQLNCFLIRIIFRFAVIYLNEHAFSAESWIILTFQRNTNILKNNSPSLLAISILVYTVILKVLLPFFFSQILSTVSFGNFILVNILVLLI